MNRWIDFRVSVLCVALCSVSRAETLDEILTHMDRSARTFQSMSAKLKLSDYTAVINDTNNRSGEVRLMRGKNGIEGLVRFDQPEAQIIHTDNRETKIYYPKANTVEVYDTSNYSGIIDRLLLGFSTSGKELSHDYTIKLVGPETVNGMPTTRISLTPKTPDLQKLVSTIDLWIPEGESYPVQEKAITPSKDYKLFDYSDVKISPPAPKLKESDLKLNAPKSAREIHPQK